MLKALAAVTAAVLALVFAQTAFAATDIYSGLGQGSDISYPQCGRTYPSGAAFGIVGIDHGRPFDVDNQYGPNTCLPSEYRWAPAATQALYMNTGYDPTYWTNHQVSACVAQMTADTLPQEAREVGCAFAWFNFHYALDPTTAVVSSGSAAGVTWTRYGQGLATPKMWWLDVETGNSWSSTDLSLNADTLQGAVDELRSLDASINPNIPIGAYSTSYQWGQIAGSNPVNNLSAIWVASGQKSSKNVTSYCTKTFDGFQSAWLVQWVGRVDYDVPC